MGQGNESGWNPDISSLGDGVGEHFDEDYRPARVFGKAAIHVTGLVHVTERQISKEKGVLAIRPRAKRPRISRRNKGFPPTITITSAAAIFPNFFAAGREIDG